MASVPRLPCLSLLQCIATYTHKCLCICLIVCMLLVICHVIRDCTSMSLVVCIFVAQATQRCVNQRVKSSCFLQMAVYIIIYYSSSLQSHWCTPRVAEWLAIRDSSLPNHSAQTHIRVMTMMHPGLSHTCVRWLLLLAALRWWLLICAHQVILVVEC